MTAAVISGPGEYLVKTGKPAKVCHIENGWAFGFYQGEPHSWYAETGDHRDSSPLDIINPWPAPWSRSHEL